MMRVRVLKAFATHALPGTHIRQGAEIEVPDDLARNWIAHGLVAPAGQTARVETSSAEPVREVAESRPQYTRADTRLKKRRR